MEVSNEKVAEIIKRYDKSIKSKKEDFITKCLVSDDTKDTIDRILLWINNNTNEDVTEIFLEEYIPYIKASINNDIDIKNFLSKGIDIDDLTQTAMLGIIESMHRYDFRENVKVRTYLCSMAKYAIKNYYRNFDSISVSREAKSIYSKYINKFDDFGEQLSYPQIKEMNSMYGIPHKKIEESILAVKNSNILYYYELDGNINCDEKTLFYSQIKRVEDYVEKYNKITDFRIIMNCIDELEPIEKFVMKKFFLEDMTQKNIARMLNKSTSYVSKIKNIAIKKIRKMIEE